MKETKEVTTTSHIVTKVICDKCGKEVKHKNYDAYRHSFEIRKGYIYPDGGDGTMYEFELCEPCMEDAIAILKKKGFKIREKDWDW